VRKGFDYFYKGAPDPLINYNFGKVEIKFPTLVDSYAIYDNKIIVKLFPKNLKEIHPQENPGRNIWCYRDDGKLLWKIEESPDWLRWLDEKSKEERGGILNDGHNDYYTSLIYIEREDKLYARVVTGYYDLDPETGKVSNFTYDGGR
jgi:hypothetical protein